ncbi:MAG: phosphoglycerate kinase [bacterium]|nr:phosphoglycerate kinase [bacterium]
MNLPDVKKFNLSGKTVFLRADLDVPLKNGKVIDDDRLKNILPTIIYFLSKSAKIIIAGHLDSPNGKPVKSLSLKPVASRLSVLLKKKIIFSDINEISDKKKGWEAIMLENLRFYPGEERNDKDFSRKLASLADFYVNDAFGTSHRNHASLVGAAKLLPHAAGFNLLKEIAILKKVINSPKRPLVLIIGGEKISTKLPLIEKFHRFADFVLIGGKLAQEETILLKLQHQKIAPPKAALLVADLTKDGKDITIKSAENFAEIIEKAKTVIWNGPVGKIGTPGNIIIAKAIAKTSAFKVAGGGDTISLIDSLSLSDKFTWLSAGGGAMLAFLAGKKLPALEALKTKRC